MAGGSISSLARGNGKLLTNSSSGVSILLILVLFLAGCGGKPSQCSDPLGCIELAQGEPIVLGTILAMMGPKGQTGTQALELMQEYISTQPEISGHPFSLIHYGTDCSPQDAQKAATEFSSVDNLAMVIGPSCLEEKTVAEGILHQAGIALLGPILDATSAIEMLLIAVAALRKTATQFPNQTLSIPRQALFEALQITP